jgi:hypothetical protein
MNFITYWLISLPEQLSRYFTWFGPLFARIVLGWTDLGLCDAGWFGLQPRFCHLSNVTRQREARRD